MQAQKDLIVGENIIKRLKEFHLGFDDFSYGQINERVKESVENFKIETANLSPIKSVEDVFNENFNKLAGIKRMRSQSFSDDNLKGQKGDGRKASNLVGNSPAFKRKGSY